MSGLTGLMVFGFVGSVSPGPNNAVLWASGLRFGFRRTIPHVVGTALGIGGLLVGVAAGVGALSRSFPAIELALRIAGSAYLLYIAYLVAGSGAADQLRVSRPLSVWQAVAFQLTNPKAWIFAIAVVGTFLPVDLQRPVGVAIVTGALMVVVAGSSSIWAVGGAALFRVFEDERKRRVVSVTMAVLLVASVALIWI